MLSSESLTPRLNAIVWTSGLNTYELIDTFLKSEGCKVTRREVSGLGDNVVVVMNHKEEQTRSHPTKCGIFHV